MARALMNSIIKGQKLQSIGKSDLEFLKIRLKRHGKEGRENWHSHPSTKTDFIIVTSARMLLIYLLFHEHLLYIRGSDIQ